MKELVDYIESLTETDRINLTGLVGLGTAKCKELLAVAEKTGSERNIKFAQVAVILATWSEARF